MYICIEGNIGSGKTTLAVALAKRRGAFFLAEQFVDNPLLPLFYKHKRKMAFPLEYSFLISRHEQLHYYFKGKSEKPTVADFSLHKCLWFAKANLTKEEFKFYKKHFKVIDSVTKRPDLIIYLNTDTKNLLKNIEKRGRSYEKSIGKKYLQSVTKCYDEGIREIEKIPVIEFEINKYGSKTNHAIVNKVDDILKKGIKFKYKRIVL
jgi:deoxyadenosine/deoxycytidine kinase